jgi:hypothetical protein
MNHIASTMRTREIRIEKKKQKNKTKNKVMQVNVAGRQK